MKTRLFSALALIAILPASLSAQEAPPVRPMWERAFLEGKFNLDLRLRYEFADQEGLDAAHAATARTRIGYTTLPSLPLSALVELEDIRAADRDAYNVPGRNNQPGKTAIADPATTELNQVYLRYNYDFFTAIGGRQRIILDNHRFVGNVGWRQNEQTFDALTLRYQPGDDTSVFYGYVDQVNRVFGGDNPLGRWESDSHLIHVLHPLPVRGNLGGYLHLLRFDNAASMSGDTAGLWVRPMFSVASYPVTLHLEAAYQRENSASPVGADFGHTYFRSSIETTRSGYTAGIGFERLGGDGATAFQTPLATLHAFNGWADRFLVTPPDGLDDYFLFLTAPLPAALTGRVELHHFESHRGSTTYGQEIDLSLSRPLSRFATALAKAALFQGRGAQPDVTKFWVQTEFRL
jgi:hypothetical protein